MNKDLTTSKDVKNFEIEHKYLLPDSFDLNAFRVKVQELKPLQSYKVDVIDRYFVVKNIPQYIYRHRVDAKLQVLTAKSNLLRQGEDNEIREEINIPLSSKTSDHGDQVSAFMQTLGPHWSGCIVKKVEVFDFSKCEICYYEAHKENSTAEGRTLFRCIEFEAKKFSTVEAALAQLKNFEDKFGFLKKNREKSSIFQLVFANEITNNPILISCASCKD